MSLDRAGDVVRDIRKWWEAWTERLDIRMKCSGKYAGLSWGCLGKYKMRGQGRVYPLLCLLVVVVADLALTNKTLLEKFSMVLRFVELGLVKVKQKGLLT